MKTTIKIRIAKKILLLAYALFFINVTGWCGTTWAVGPTRIYKAPSQVSTLVQNGDTVNIDAGTYAGDVCSWSASNLTLRGVGGLASLNAKYTAYGDKAIWEINGNNTTVENIEFYNCNDTGSTGSTNWAGIRQGGTGLTVMNCYFHNNNDGILENNVAASNIIIEYTEFAYNGYGDGQTHNVYIGSCNELYFCYNYTHGAVVGHELKTRANTSIILYNRITDNQDGTASRDIDMPSGGTDIIMGNIIEKGPNASNSNAIEWGLEGVTDAGPQKVIMVNNTFVNDRTNGTILFYIKTGLDSLKFINNIVAGPGIDFLNTAYGSPTVLDSATNLVTASVPYVGLVNAATFDYHLTSTSPAITKGSHAGSADTIVLTPIYEYADSAKRTKRVNTGKIDIGAYAYGGSANYVPTIQKPGAATMYVYTDFYDASINVFFSNTNSDKDVYLYDITGKLIAAQERVASAKVTFARGSLSSGTYLIKSVVNGICLSTKFTMQ